MNKQELISIIIPVYNIETYLPRCLETVAAQSYQDLEIILIDDGSTDHSGEICDAFVETDKRAIVIHQHNSGLWAARNSGQRIARGNYLMFVDGDDYMHKDIVRIMYEALQRYKCDLAFVSLKETYKLDEKTDSIEENRIALVSQKQLMKRILRGGATYGAVWNKLYRKSLIDGIWSRDYPRIQDVDFNMRVYMRTNQAVWIQRDLYFWVQRFGSLTKTSDYRPLHCLCWVNISYRNQIEIPSNCFWYRGLLLKKLYRKMVFLKNSRWSSVDKVELCHKYEKSTKKAYWLNWRINPLEKIVVTILLHSPRLTRWLMKVTKNY